nr:hypothetical protein [uncultured bacterium]
MVVSNEYVIYRLRQVGIGIPGNAVVILIADERIDQDRYVFRFDQNTGMAVVAHSD